MGNTAKSANRWLLFTVNPPNTGWFIIERTNTRRRSGKITWSNSDGFTSVPHIKLINPKIRNIGKIYDTSIGYRSSSSVLLHASLRVPAGSVNVFNVSGIDDHTSTGIHGTGFDVVDGGCDGVDEDQGDRNRLKGKWQLRVPVEC